MKGFFNAIQWTPKNLKQNVETESFYHKARIVGWSILAFIIALSFDIVFQSVTYRAQQF